MLASFPCIQVGTCSTGSQIHISSAPPRLPYPTRQLVDQAKATRRFRDKLQYPSTNFSLPSISVSQYLPTQDYGSRLGTNIKMFSGDGQDGVKARL